MALKFETNAIIARCKEDCDKFLQETGVPLNGEFTLELDYLKAGAAVDSLLQRFVVSSKYVDTIAVDKFQFWYGRTLLFYQILLVTEAALKNKEAFDNIFKDITVKRDFNAQLVTASFTLGIYGSMTPTSDIDVGVQSTVGYLADFVCAFESIFLKLTGVKSLDFDIETYADLITRKVDGKDVFYLSATDFTIVDFTSLLETAAKSIARNYCFSCTDEERKDVEHLVTEMSLDKLPFIKGFWSNAEIKNALISTWDANCRAALTDVLAYLKEEYDAQRTEYYARVDAAENAVKEYQGEKSPTAASTAKVMKVLGDALTWREESYLLVPTIVKVVRILQAQKSKALKYATSIPKAYCKGEIVNIKDDPFCTIGEFGYALSCLEEIGYLYRFMRVYCPPNPSGEPEKCSKKYKKYRERFDDGFWHFNANKGYSEDPVLATVVQPTVDKNPEQMKPTSQPSLVRAGVNSLLKAVSSGFTRRPGVGGTRQNTTRRL